MKFFNELNLEFVTFCLMIAVTASALADTMIFLHGWPAWMIWREIYKHHSFAVIWHVGKFLLAVVYVGCFIKIFIRDQIK